MLGLTVSSELSSTADFELITRLEKLILANQTNVNSTLPVDNACSDVASKFRHRLTDEPSINHRRPDTDADDEDDDDDVPDSSRSNEGQKVGSRSRSRSPVRNRDPNIY